MKETEFPGDGVGVGTSHCLQAGESFSSAHVIVVPVQKAALKAI